LGYRKSNAHHNLVNALVSGFRDGVTGEELLALESVPEAATARKERLFANVDGIKFLTHHLGCGGTPRDGELLCALLAGYINHANVAGATVLSLGCQNAQANILRDEIAKRNPDFDKPLFIFEQQASTSEHDMLSEAIRKTFVGLTHADLLRRSAVPLSRLVIGMECGGSDGFSGVSANPVMGSVADLVVACGGSVILAEFPEFCGGEQVLLDRCVDEATARRFIELYEAYEKRARSVGARFDMNPSAGNIREGLITDAIKSAGAIKKGGTSTVVDVLDYPGWVTKPGLTLLCTPGGDVESTTALAAAGANVILFSTGMGTPTGNPIVPVVKIASNTSTAKKLADIIDFDAGPIIDGVKSIEMLAAELLSLAVDVASQRCVPKAVQLGHDEFIPWKRDVSL
jgi:altronate hydrolase